jgi:alpha-mannosidase
MFPALKPTCKRVLLLTLSGALVFAGRAVAQRGEMFRATLLLPSDSRVVAERLAGLRELPAGTWKLHVGDVAHGEDVNLDDSSWQTVAVGEKAPNEAV